MVKGKRIKKKSKRMSLSQKYKIMKKVKEHHRKVKKDKRKHPEKYPKKKKDPGVPNGVPFKAQIVREAQEALKLEEERREKIRMDLKLRRKEDRGNAINEKRNLNSYLENVANKKKEYEIKNKIETSKNGKLTDKSAKAYYKEFRKVVEASDVILEVLDSRDPQGTRCTTMEEYVLSKSGKKLVLVLNKADLVPKDNLRSWLSFLRCEYPAIIFKASTQSQANRLSHVKVKYMKKSASLETSNCIGADTLMQLLKNYCRNNGIKTAITVGVVGLPNVGKSSLINSLKRSKACNIGAMPGITKNLQKVLLDSKISLLDCPGIVLPGGDTNNSSASLRNIVKVDNIEDPITPVEAILQRAGKEQMMLHYCLPDFKDTEEFLCLLGKKSGRLLKGGIVNAKAAAISVLNDWNGGKIKYYTRPPVTEEGKSVSTLNKEFDVFSLKDSEDKSIESLPGLMNIRDTFCIEALEPITEVSEMEVCEEEEGEPQSEMLLENVEIVKNDMEPTVSENCEKKERWETEVTEVDTSVVPLKKLQKKVQKKQRKEHNRNLKRTDELVECFGALEASEKNDNYEFKDYFSVT